MSDSPPPGDSPGLTTRDKVRRLAIALAIVLCLGGIAWGASSTREVDDNGDVIADTGDPADVEISGDSSLIEQQPPGAATGGPSESEIVEQTIPAEDAEILQQAQIGIDVGNVYDVIRLSINGTIIRDDELIRRPQLNQVFFQPAEGFTFDALPSGRVCAQADVVRISDPSEVVRSVEWCFEVT